jgi:hypothetical protein
LSLGQPLFGTPFCLRNQLISLFARERAALHQRLDQCQCGLAKLFQRFTFGVLRLRAEHRSGQRKPEHSALQFLLARRVGQ